MEMNNKFFVVLLLIVILLGCSKSGSEYKPSGEKTNIRKPMSWGHKQTIYIFADDNVWKYAETPLRESLERFWFTVRNESFFDIKRAKFEAIEQFYKFNNLIFLCDLESNEEVSKYIKEKVGKKVVNEVKANSIGMYPANNLWANDQFILFLIGDNERNLLSFNILQANKTFELFRDKLYQRIAAKIYKMKIHTDNFFNGLSWKFKLPMNYVLYKKDKDFISFLARQRKKADRFISVYSEKMAEDNIGKEWLKERRSELVWKYYDEDEFSESDIRIERGKLNEHKCWKLSGRWQNKKYAVGGAFQSFAFYDEKTKSAFLIDNSVYYPEGDKIPSLIELEVISRTFQIKEERGKE